MRRRNLLITILILSAFAILEVYAHTYVSHLSISDQEEVINYLPRKYYYINGTKVFQSNVYGSKVVWLIAWRFRKPTPSLNPFYFYLFKINRDGTFLIQDHDIIPYKIQTISKGVYHEDSIHAFLREVIKHSNHTIVISEYEIGAIDTYNVTFILFSRLYAKTLLGYTTMRDTEISINVTMDYKP